MAQRFQNQTVFITGASSGIGAALAVAFAREGANIGLAARRAERLDEVRGKIEAIGRKAVAVTCDVRDRASLDAAVAKVVAAFGRIDVAVANAGFDHVGLFEKLTTDDFRGLFATNFFGVVDTIYAVLPHLKRSKGRLGVLSSVLGQVAMPISSPYCASKFAVCGLTGSLSYELAPHGVSVTTILPGFVESEIRHLDNEGRYDPAHKDPAPAFLVMPTEKAAQAIVNALYKRKPEAVITGHGKVLIAVNRHFPRFTRFLMSKGRKLED